MITIKTATKEHKPYLMEAMAGLLEYVRDSSQDEYLLWLTNDYINDSAQWIENIFSSDQSVVFVAEEGGLPDGYVIGSITPSTHSTAVFPGCMNSIVQQVVAQIWGQLCKHPLHN